MLQRAVQSPTEARLQAERATHGTAELGIAAQTLTHLQIAHSTARVPTLLRILCLLCHVTKPRQSHAGINSPPVHWGPSE